MPANQNSTITDTGQAVQLAAELVFHPNIIPTYNLWKQSQGPIHQPLHDAVMAGMEALGHRDAAAACHSGVGWIRALFEDVDLQQWSRRFEAAFRNQEFDQLIRSCVEASLAGIRDTHPGGAFAFGGNTRSADDSPQVMAYRLAADHLIGNSGGARWLTLTLFALTRAIGVNASQGFQSDQWSEATLMWFQLERDWLNGNGEQVAKLLVEMNREIFSGAIPQIVGGKIDHALAELVLNAFDSRFFSELKETKH